MKFSTQLSAALLAACGVMGAAHAGVTTIPNSALVPSNYYYTDQIGGGLGTPVIMTGGDHGANVGSSTSDDGFSGPINLSSAVSFFGQTYTQFWANNNGNISFNGGIAAYTPTGPQGAAQPIISPFFADVDTRFTGSGVLYVRNDIPNETIITWDQVGYYNNNAGANAFDSFQLVLRGAGYNIPTGEGAIGFFYKDMNWETGTASGGTNGFGGTPAAVGFGDGQGNGEILQASVTPGVSGIVNDSHIWFDPNLAVVPSVPEPETYALMLAGLGLIGAMVRRRKANQA